MRTKQQQIDDSNGDLEQAEKYAVAAREIIKDWQLDKISADDALESLRWELGAGEGETGVDIDDPFLDHLDRRDIKRIYKEASPEVIKEVRGSR